MFFTCFYLCSICFHMMLVLGGAGEGSENIKKHIKNKPLLQPDTMRCFRRRTCVIQIDSDTIIHILQLPTIDATQTAFATHNIHISESTAMKWREYANDGQTHLVNYNTYASTDVKPTQSCVKWAWSRLNRHTSTEQSEQPPMP